MRAQAAAVKVIAELGSNPVAYGWDFDLFCRKAYQVGADAVKVQLWHHTHFPQWEHDGKRPLEFPRSRLQEFVRVAHSYGLEAGASVFDDDAVQLAAEHCDWLKLAAREFANRDLMAKTIAAAASRGKKVLRSVPHPHANDLVTKLTTTLTTLYAEQAYPAGMARSLWNLIRFSTSCWWAQVPWGWSSHTSEWLDCWLAASLGACVIEKHLALSPDDCEAGHSLQPLEFMSMVNSIRSAE